MVIAHHGCRILKHLVALYLVVSSLIDTQKDLFGHPVME